MSIRKTVTLVEEINSEYGAPANPPLRRVAIAAVFDNPLAGKAAGADLKPLIDFSVELGASLTATYWEIGRRIVEFEQGGMKRAGYGEELLKQLATDLTASFGRGFSKPNLERMRRFYLALSPGWIASTLSRRLHQSSIADTSSDSEISIASTLSRQLTLDQIASALPLPWSHYIMLIMRARSPEALEFYHAEALRGGC